MLSLGFEKEGPRSTVPCRLGECDNMVFRVFGDMANLATGATQSVLTTAPDDDKTTCGTCLKIGWVAARKPNKSSLS